MCRKAQAGKIGRRCQHASSLRSLDDYGIFIRCCPDVVDIVVMTDSMTLEGIGDDDSAQARLFRIPCPHLAASDGALSWTVLRLNATATAALP